MLAAISKGAVMSSVYGRLPVSGHYLRKRLRYAGFALRLAIFALVLLFATMAIFRLGGIGPQALIALLLLVAFIAATALLISVWGLVRVWYRGVDGGRTVVAACCLSLLVLFPFTAVTYLAFVNPRANAAYTEALAPEGVAPTATPARTSWQAVFAAPIAPEQPSIVSGRRFIAEAPRVYQAARMVAEDSGWQIEAVVADDPSQPAAPEPAEGDLGISGLTGIPIPTPRAQIDRSVAPADPLAVPESTQYRIEAVRRDLLFALPSDLVVRIAEDDGDTYVDMQSVSRFTGIDLGENRRIIEGFLADLDMAMAGLETLETTD
jgi:hypothetical protein